MSNMKIAKKNYMYINEEKLYKRLSELYEYIENFPEGLMANAARSEIEYLESLK